MTRSIEPIERLEFEANELMASHPPILRDANKQTVYDIACPRGSVHHGHLVYTRWRAMPLPARVDIGAGTNRIVGVENIYDYEPVLGSADGLEWHVNFADPSLFGFYGSGLFAQDEMQTAEHPALGALREALLAQGREPVTVENGAPTPVLVRGVERWCRVATNPNAAEGRPRGLYGNAFALASTETVRHATSRIEPPTITNLIAIAAPAGGQGHYTAAEIENILVTAFTGFRAAVLESHRARGTNCRVAVHTGFWGCGAFGGDKVLMALLQMVAAQMAGVDRVVVHTFDGHGTRALERARRVAAQEIAGSVPVATAALITQVAAMGFGWGRSDGN